MTIREEHGHFAGIQLDGVDNVRELPPPPARPADAHKGTFGSVLVVAGSTGMSGAAILAGRAALHGGAGLVTVAIPRNVASLVAGGHCSYMTLPLPENPEGSLDSEATPLVLEACERQSSAAVGPGLGRGDCVTRVVSQLFQRCPLPLVLDADGLNAFVGQVDRLAERDVTAARVLTPHPGEFARLTGHEAAVQHADRAKQAVAFARQHEVVLVLKGRRSLITDGKRLAVNSTGNTALSTGGTGDVLTGLIASLLAQQMPALEAAQLGAHLHGLAGDAAAEKHTDRFVTSMEILQNLDVAWQRLLAGE